MAFITFLCPLRNRNIDYLVQSFIHQTEKDFILMLVDYGSDENYTSQYKNFAKQYHFITYIEIPNVKQKFWNKSIVLNTSLPLIATENVIITDADLYFEKDFFKLLKQNFKENIFYLCIFRRLLSDKDNELFLKNHKNYQYKIIKSEITPSIYAGNTSLFKEIGGYDTFFRIWGREDNEFHKAIQKKNIPIEIIDFENAPIYHIWHPLENLDLPENWLQIIQEHEKQNLNREKRPNFLNDKTHFSNHSFDNIRLEYPLSYQINAIHYHWQQLKTAEIFYLKQNFDNIEIKKGKKLGKILHFFNQFLQKLKISYRIIPLEKYEKKNMNFKEAKDFIFYFILTQEKNIKDYEVNFDEKKLEIEWKMIKK